MKVKLAVERAACPASTPGPTYCSSCGTANDPSNTYCSNCGRMLNP